MNIQCELNMKVCRMRRIKCPTILSTKEKRLSLININAILKTMIYPQIHLWDQANITNMDHTLVSNLHLPTYNMFGHSEIASVLE